MAYVLACSLLEDFPASLTAKQIAVAAGRPPLDIALVEAFMLAAVAAFAGHVAAGVVTLLWGGMTNPIANGHRGDGVRWTTVDCGGQLRVAVRISNTDSPSTQLQERGLNASFRCVFVRTPSAVEQGADSIPIFAKLKLKINQAQEFQVSI